MSRILTIQGRQLFPSDIEAIRLLITDHPKWHRTRLSKELCKRWGWRTETGLLKDMACRSMLRKLEQKELVTLPVAHHSGNRQRRIPDVPHSCNPIETDLHTARPIQLVVIQGRGAADDLFHCLMDKYHLRLMTNNTRFLIFPWVRIPHLASHILGTSLRGCARIGSQNMVMTFAWWRLSLTGPVFSEPATVPRTGTKSVRARVEAGKTQIINFMYRSKTSMCIR